MRRCCFKLVEVSLFLALSLLVQSACRAGVTELPVGKVGVGDILTTAVTFFNDSAETISVASVKRTYGCTMAILSPPELGPGQQGKLVISLSPSAEGPFEQYVWIENSSGRHISDVVLVGMGYTRFRVVPDTFSTSLSLEQFEKGMLLLSAEIWSGGVFFPTDLAAFGDNSWANVRVVRLSERVARLEIRAVRRPPLGLHKLDVEVRTGGEIIRRAATIDVYAPIKVSPRQFSFGIRRVGTPLEGEVQIGDTHTTIVSARIGIMSPLSENDVATLVETTKTTSAVIRFRITGNRTGIVPATIDVVARQGANEKFEFNLPVDAFYY